MAHTIRDKPKLLSRVRRIRGQVEAVERALDGGKACGEVLQCIAAARGAMNGLMAEVLEGHLRVHVAAPARESDRVKGADELVDIVRAYLK